MSNWIRVGFVTVDAGLLMVGDPCYAEYDNHPHHPIHHWDVFCKTYLERLDTSETHSVQLHHGSIEEPRSDGLGVVIATGGDGRYPVDVKLGKDGRVSEFRVKLTQSYGD